MPDYNLNIYDNIRMWINRARRQEVSWEEINFARRRNDEELQTFLDGQVIDNFWPRMTTEGWHCIVNLQKVAEEKIIRIEKETFAATITDENQDNALTPSDCECSCWQLYKAHLSEKRFSDDSIGVIEKEANRILRRCSLSTVGDFENGVVGKPIKGLVVGNVQSGKTANMAALMAMAADSGWNTFIILSGTIESLRIQTLNRLFYDLNRPNCNLSWHVINQPVPNGGIGTSAADQMFFNSNDRYMSVLLKNSTRLSNLIQWLQEDPNTQNKMKVLVIDDEADQASINTILNVEERHERTKINALISNLVNGLQIKNIINETPQFDEPSIGHFTAMNYIGYTATPYANVLNDNAYTSLYPRSFISTLSAPKEYFGPQQIFGSTENEKYTGLNIVRKIGQHDLDQLHELHDGNIFDIPDSLKDSICWFICCVATMRFRGSRKPLTLLIHTSQNTIHHGRVATAITQWLCTTDYNDILEHCQLIWEEETTRFSIDSFRQQYSDYRNMEALQDYPAFDDIIPYIHYLLAGEDHERIEHIRNTNQGTFVYSNGIHLCIDNNVSNDPANYNLAADINLRLRYPDNEEEYPENAPAFIAIGGQTLSRGLTLEGLVSSYFLRAVSQADTLMQMGRWFGYRRGYELLPRMWMTSKTYDQYCFLSSLDEDLRKELFMREAQAQSALSYGPSIKNTPKISFLRIVAANRMQMAIAADFNYAGTTTQTFLFERNQLQNNLECTIAFLNKLGNAEATNNPHAKGSYVWRNIPNDTIEKFLMAYQFCPRQKAFNNIDMFLEWIKAARLDNWNVVLVGKHQGNNEKRWSLNNNISIYKVNRSKLINDNPTDDTINIGVLRSPKDILSDIDLTTVPNEIRQKIEQYNTGDNPLLIRNSAGLENTPQLLIYVIDCNSTANQNSNRRENLNSGIDIVGLCVNLPGNNNNQVVARISIRPEDNYDIDMFSGDDNDIDDVENNQN